MRAALITIMHNYLGYGYVSGQVCHRHFGCMRCMDDTAYLQLPQEPGSSRTVYMGASKVARMTCGEGVKICSMVQRRREDIHVKGAVSRSIRC